MVINFTFGNYRSFRDETTLSMVAASRLQADAKRDAANVFTVPNRPKLQLLRVAAIYGANASGKSNIASAFSVFQRTVVESANTDFHSEHWPFLFQEDTALRPGNFELTFLLEGIQFRYGFEARTVEEGIEVTSEWLYQANSTVEFPLFERTERKVTRNQRRFREGTALLKDDELRRSNALFLSLVAQIGGDISARVVEFIRNGINVISGLDDAHLRQHTIDCWKSGRYHSAIMRLMREADTGVPQIRVLDENDPLLHQFTVRNASDAVQQTIRGQLQLLAIHDRFDSTGQYIDAFPMPFDVIESEGTKKLFAFAGPILETLEKGETLFVDEMDARFHPLLTLSLVRLFQSPETNPKNAQLIFVTHDTNLLSSADFRRDQIWFVEKDRMGASHLYSLADFKGVRKDDPFEQDYINGRFGAIPFLGGLSRLFGPQVEAETTPTEEKATPATILTTGKAKNGAKA